LARKEFIVHHTTKKNHTKFIFFYFLKFMAILFWVCHRFSVAFNKWVFRWTNGFDFLCSESCYLLLENYVIGIRRAATKSHPADNIQWPVARSQPHPSFSSCFYKKKLKFFLIFLLPSAIKPKTRQRQWGKTEGHKFQV